METFDVDVVAVGPRLIVIDPGNGRLLQRKNTGSVVESDQKSGDVPRLLVEAHCDEAVRAGGIDGFRDIVSAWL